MKLRVPFHRQSKRYTCAPACLRIVLEYYGSRHKEDDISTLCKTTWRGTTARNLVDSAKKLGFKARSESLDTYTLKRLLNNKIPIIVYLDSEHLTGDLGIHANVVIGIEEKVTVIDPLIGERSYSRKKFEKAWKSVNKIAIIIERS